MTEFRELNDRTEMMKNKKWVKALNFTVTILRQVDGKWGGPVVLIRTPQHGDASFRGQLKDTELLDPKHFQANLKTVIPELSCLLIFLSKQELKHYWDWKFTRYDQDFPELYGYEHGRLTGVGKPGWHGNHFILSENVHVDMHGELVPEQNRTVYYTPMGRSRDCSPEVETPFSVEPARELYGILRETQPPATYMGGLILGGAVLQALHYQGIRATYMKAPVAVAVGPSETGKSLMARMACATIGLSNAMYSRITPALMHQLLGDALLFVFNDPDANDKDTLKALKVAIGQGFEVGSSATITSCSRARTCPLVTANPPVLASLRGLQDNTGCARELSRLVVVPFNDSAAPVPARVQELLPAASQAAGALVAVGCSLVTERAKHHIERLREDLLGVIPEQEAGNRMAHNCAMLAVFGFMYNRCLGLGLPMREFADYAKTVLVELGVMRHQARLSLRYSEFIFDVIHDASEQLSPVDFLKTVSIRRTGDKGQKVPGLVVRAHDLAAEMGGIQSQYSVTESKLRENCQRLHNVPPISVKFGARVLRCYILPEAVVPAAIWRLVREAQDEVKRNRRVRPQEQPVAYARVRGGEDEHEQVEDDARVRGEEDEHGQAEDDACVRGEEDEHGQAEDDARVRGEEDEHEQAEDDARVRGEEDEHEQAEDDARVRGEEDEHEQAEDDARVRGEEDEHEQAEDDARVRGEEDEHEQAEDDARVRGEEDEQPIDHTPTSTHTASESVRSSRAVIEYEARDEVPSEAAAQSGLSGETCVEDDDVEYVSSTQGKDPSRQRIKVEPEANDAMPCTVAPVEPDANDAMPRTVAPVEPDANDAMPRTVAPVEPDANDAMPRTVAPTSTEAAQRLSAASCMEISDEGDDENDDVIFISFIQGQNTSSGRVKVESGTSDTVSSIRTPAKRHIDVRQPTEPAKRPRIQEEVEQGRSQSSNCHTPPRQTVEGGTTDRRNIWDAMVNIEISATPPRQVDLQRTVRRAGGGITKKLVMPKASTEKMCTICKKVLGKRWAVTCSKDGCPQVVHGLCAGYKKRAQVAPQTWTCSSCPASK